MSRDDPIIFIFIFGLLVPIGTVIGYLKTKEIPVRVGDNDLDDDNDDHVDDDDDDDDDAATTTPAI